VEQKGSQINEICMKEKPILKLRKGRTDFLWNFFYIILMLKHIILITLNLTKNLNK
jgi:hypothetical protein